MINEQKFKKFTKEQRSTFSYWFYHVLVFNLVARELHCWKFKYLFHDFEKPWLKLFFKYATVQKFVHNEFPIVVNGRDIYYKDFDYESERFFKSRANSLTATVYYSYPDCKVTDEMLIILFNYYNFAGTPQTESHKEKLQSLISV